MVINYCIQKTYITDGSLNKMNSENYPKLEFNYSYRGK